VIAEFEFPVLKERSALERSGIGARQRARSPHSDDSIAATTFEEFGEFRRMAPQSEAGRASVPQT